MFAAHRFDNKFLIRVLTATEAYQRTSAGAVVATAEQKVDSTDDPALFARMPLRGLTRPNSFSTACPWPPASATRAATATIC